MIISRRFMVITIILLALALVPTIIHSYIEAKADDGLRVNVIGKTLSGFSSNPTARRAAWVKDTFDSHDWVERRYTAPGNNIVLLFVARSFDLKRLYHHPEIGVLRGVDLEMKGIEKLKGTANVPAHILRSRTGKGLAAYVLHYDGRFIENPIKTQIKASLELLFSKRKAMTLFLIYVESAGPDVSLEELPASMILEAAITDFLARR